MKIKYLIFILVLAALCLHPKPATASGFLYEAHAPATGNYTSFCNADYHGLGYCNFTNSFSFDNDQIVTALTLFDLGCNSRDGIELFFHYRLMNADNHHVVAETIHKRHMVCTPNYPEGHNVPTTLEIEPVELSAHQNYYVMLSVVGNKQVRAYWGVNAEHKTSFRVHGLAAPKAPVILVPGIMGSSLKRVSNGGEVWPNANEMVLSGSDSYLDELKLGTGGGQISGTEMVPGAILKSASFSIFGQDVVTQSLYGGLVKEFTDRGYIAGRDLFEAAYDWRLDMRGEVARLESAVAAARAASPGSKVTLVAHSMGGLLVKQYLSVPENAALVEKVILIGTPQLGAPVMFKVLNYGDNLGFQFPIIHKDLLNPSTVKAIAQNMPGTYQLLPSQMYVEAAGSYVRDFRNGASKDLSYDETKDLMTGNSSDARNANLIEAGQDFHDALDRNPIDGPKVYNVIACGNPSTIGKVRLYDRGKIDIESIDGDGTVPLASAAHLADSYSNYFVDSQSTGIDHGRLVKDGRATSLIGALAEGTNIPVQSGIGTSTATCFGDAQMGPATVRFSTHRHAALHIYDFAGRHTGPIPDGVEIGIPDSSYTTLGENNFAFVPAGGTYRIVVDGTAEGRFDLEAQTLEGAEVVSAVNYVDVPIAIGSARAEAVFSEDDPAPDLSLDQDGDGSADESFAPTGQLSGAEAEDSEPPQIIFSGIPSGAIPTGTPFTVSFSATDLLSGVATTSATFDGVPFNSGATLISQAAGQRVIVIEAVDKAGNPRTLTVEFVQAAIDSASEPAPQPPAGGNSGGSSSGNNKKYSRSGGQAGKANEFSFESQGQVAGAAITAPAPAIPSSPLSCLKVPSGNLGRGKNNDWAQVILLQEFLSRELAVNIPVTGFFGPITELAAKLFQLKHYADVLAPAGLVAPTGFVGAHTLAKMAALACI